MSRRRNPFRTALLVLLLLLPGAVALLLNTDAGMRWTIRLMQKQVDGLTIGAATGRLSGPFELRDVRWSNGPEVSVERIRIDWQPMQLLWQGRLQIDHLAMNGLELRIDRDAGKNPERSKRRDPGLRLPLAAEVTRLELEDVRIALGESEPWRMERLGARLHGYGDRIDIEALEARVSAPQTFAVTGSARLPLDGSGPLALDASLNGQFSDLRLDADITATGSTSAFEFTLHGHTPVKAEITGNGSLEGEQRWQLTADVHAFALNELRPQAPAISIGRSAIEADGAGATFEARINSSIAEPRLGLWELDLSGGWDGSLWTLSRLRATERAGEGRITARARQDGPTATRFQSEVQWQHLALAGLGSERGKLDLRGAPDAYRYEIDTAIAVSSLPPLALTARGDGDLGGTRIHQMKAAWLDGTITGDADLSWQDRSGRVELELTDLDPGLLRPDLAGRISARAALFTQQNGSSAIHRARIDDLRGMLGSMQLSGEAQLELDGAGDGNATVRLAAGDASLKGSATFGPEWLIDWRLEASDLAIFVPGMSGEMSARGNHHGPADALLNRIDLQARNITHRGIGASTVDGYLELALAESGSPRWRSVIDVEGAHVDMVELGRIVARSEGTPEAHAVSLQSRHDILHFDQRLRGSFADGIWRGTLEDGRLVQVDVGTWTQRSPAGLAFTGSSFTLERLCWDSVGAAICAALNSSGLDGNNGRRHSAELEWSELELRRFSTILPLEIAEFAGISNGRARAAIDAGKIRASVSANARDGLFRYPLPGQAGMQTLRYRDAQLDAVAGDDGLSGSMTLALRDPDGSLTASFSMPGYSPPDLPTAGQHLRVELRGDIALDAESLFIPDIHLGGGGSAQLDLALTGTLGEPLLDGSASVTIGRLNILPLGSQLDELRLDAGFQKSAIALSGSGRMGDGTLVIGGSGSFRTPGDWEAIMALSGSDLSAVRVPTAQITASPDISVRVTPRELGFDGKLTIPRAKLEPVRPESAISPSDDIVVQGGPEEDTRDPLRLQGRLEFILGDEVRISGRGFEGRLTGRTVLIAAGDSITAQGEITVADGRYRAYGQNLSITQGRILYAGGSIDNPAIDIVASRTRGENDEIQVGVRVLGTARTPTVELYSSPAMDDADILSWLIIGRPLSEARAGEGADLYQAATSVAIAGGGALAAKISERFNLVEFSIESGEQNEDAALVLGRSLSPRLYVRYIQGLMEDTNAIQFRYKLGEKWILETESGTRTGAGADLLYSLER